MKDSSTSHGILSSIVKVLTQRSALHVIDNEISSRQVLKVISESIQKRFDREEKCHFKGNKYIDEFMDLFKNNEEETDDFYSSMALLNLAFTRKDSFYEYLVRIKG